MTTISYDNRIGKSVSELRFSRNPDVVQREVDDTVFLVNPVDDTIFYLNALSTGLWHLLATPVTCPEAIYIVKEAFPNTPPEKIASDVAQLFKELEKNGLIRCQD